MMKPTLLNVAGVVSIILCIVLCVIETVLKIVEGGPPSEVGLIVVTYLLITTLAVITIFGKLGPHPAKYDAIADWMPAFIGFVFATMLLVQSLIIWDPFYLVVAIVCILGISATLAGQCGLIAKPLATPPTTPPFSRLNRDSRCNMWILLLWVVYLLVVIWDNRTIWETIIFGMLTVSCGIVAFSPSIDYVTDAETLTAQQEEPVATNYEGMPL